MPIMIRFQFSYLDIFFILYFREILKNSPEQISQNIAKKNYLAAAKLIVQAHEILQGALQKVEGLKDVRSDVISRQEVFEHLFIYSAQSHIVIRN